MSTEHVDPGAGPSEPLGGPAPPSAGDPPRALTDTRPEILVGAALAGGFVLARLLGRIRGV